MDIERLEGETFGDYKIEEVLRSIREGFVYKARQISLNQVVILRVFSPSVSSSKLFSKIFERDAHLAAKLKHENIAQVYNVGMENGCAYVSAEYVEGQSLGEKLKKEKTLGVDEAIGITLQVAQAIQCAHRAGVIHGHITPSDIILAHDEMVKISFFSMNRVLNRYGFETSMLDGEPMLVHGDCRYSPPEYLLLMPNPSGRADIWSLGIILYEMLTGETPFQGKTAFETRKEIMSKEYVPVRDFRTDVPASLEQVINNLLRKDAAERYQDMEAVIADLEAVQSGKPVSARRKPYLESAVRSSYAKLKKTMTQPIRFSGFRRKPARAISAVVGISLMGLALRAGIRLALRDIQHGTNPIARVQQEFEQKKRFEQLARSQEQLRIIKSPSNLSKLLFAAIAQGNVESVRVFLNYNADPNRYDPYSGLAPLHKAAALGQSEIVLALLEKGADVNAQSRDLGRTPLMMATENGQAETVRILLESKTDMTLKDIGGNTALALAEEKGFTEILRLLSEDRANDLSQN